VYLQCYNSALFIDGETTFLKKWLNKTSNNTKTAACSDTKLLLFCVDDAETYSQMNRPPGVSLSLIRYCPTSPQTWTRGVQCYVVQSINRLGKFHFSPMHCERKKCGKLFSGGPCVLASVPDSTIFERRGKQYPALSPVINVRMTLYYLSKNIELAKELFLLLYTLPLYTYQWSVNTTSYTKNEQENNALTPQHKPRVGRIDSKQYTRNGQYHLCQREPSPFQDAAVPPDT
jgi:hypothetical protein